MYDMLSKDYDRFVNWQDRLKVEMPFLEQHLQDAQRVLDAACGTGMHAIALAQRGFDAGGADLSRGMVERARLNAREAGVAVRFEAAGFGELAQAFGREAFDALLCLGNSLPHVLTSDGLHAALADFAACLRPGGLALIQNRNFDSVLARRERWMEPQAYREGENEWLFLRFYDFEPDGLINFNIVTLRREGAGAAWSQQATSTPLRPLTQAGLTAALAAAGFGEVASYGDMSEAPFDPEASGNLIVTARTAGLQ
jgi:glycine/sarcosine N-methyltransferase